MSKDVLLLIVKSHFDDALVLMDVLLLIIKSHFDDVLVLIFTSKSM